MLPAWPDCSRRSAARQFKREIEGAGFELRTTLPSIGAAVGTATHHQVTAELRRRISQPVDEQPALEIFRAEIKDGAEWDDTTPNAQAAELQIARMADALIRGGGITEHTKTLAVEVSLRADLNDEWELTGHIDHVEEREDVEAYVHLDDWKTGGIKRPYSSQVGGYVLIAKANGYKVKSASTTYVPRVKLKKPQPLPERTYEDLPMVERAAWATTRSIMESHRRFAETGDPFAFQANPMSLMCSQKYCPAHSTKFCTLHLKKETA
jgi:hypothetical protein